MFFCSHCPFIHPFLLFVFVLDLCKRSFKFHQSSQELLADDFSLNLKALFCQFLKYSFWISLILWLHVSFFIFINPLFYTFLLLFFFHISSFLCNFWEHPSQSDAIFVFCSRSIQGFLSPLVMATSWYPQLACSLLCFLGRDFWY